MSEKIDEWEEVKEKLRSFEENADNMGFTGSYASTKALRLIMEKLERPEIYVFIEKEKAFKLVGFPVPPRLGEIFNTDEGLLKVVDVSYSVPEGLIQINTVDVTREEHQKMIEEEE